MVYFPWNGIIANLPAICDLADKYNALVMVDDSMQLVLWVTADAAHRSIIMSWIESDIITGTLGKALGGASGGYTSSRKEIVGWLRQRSRPYLFSNTLAPTIAATSVKVLELLESSHHLIKKVHENSRYFRH